MSRPTAWLVPDDAEKAVRMEEFVLKEWRPEGDASPFTPHDPAHFRRVEAWIQRLIPEDRWGLLTDAERKILTWSSWTHDIGMFRKLHPHGMNDSAIRDEHVNASATWVAENHNHLQLESLVEAQVLAEVNLFHSRKYPIDSCPEQRLYCGKPVRSRLLAAYVRLADALEITHDRVEDDLHPRFDLLIHQMSRDGDNTLFHWVKSFVVAGIAVDHQRKLLTIEFMRDHDLPEHKFEHIKRYVVNEIEDELASVERTLAIGGISSVHFTNVREVDVIGGRVQAQLKDSVQRVLNYIQMTRSPNSTAVTMAALDAAAALVERTNKEADRTAAWSHFAEGLELLNKSLAHQLRTRSCHIELRRVQTFITGLASRVEGSKTTERVEAFVSDLSNYTSRFARHIGNDYDRDRLLAEHFFSVLDGGPARSHANFVLFGCSETVARCLAGLQQRRKAKQAASLAYSVWIAEGRPKTQYGAHNVPTYCDAVTYVQTLINAGCRPKEIHIIPDASVATRIDRGVADHNLRIDAVLFGTNGIYLGDDVYVAHTAGHLGIAMIAATTDVPVIVLGAAAKIVEEPPREWQQSTRGGSWFTPNLDVVLSLEEKTTVPIDSTWNPREDHVPMKFLTAIVTEKGVVRRSDPNPIQTLQGWMRSVEEVLGNSSKHQSRKNPKLGNGN
jgi:translation initiation factor 2B subunit (eIF-2B alpha/beta/delta family)